MYSAVLCSRADSMRTLACDSEWVTVSFYNAYPWKWCTGSALWLLYGWCHVKCCRFGASSVYTIQPCTRLQCHFIQSHIGTVYACLPVTFHLHLWQNDRDLLRATAVTRGWNGYPNKSHHRKLTLEKKTLPPLLQGFEPATFQSRVRSFTGRSNHWAIPLPFMLLLPCWGTEDAEIKFPSVENPKLSNVILSISIMD